MGEQKRVTLMLLKVDLQCPKCYRKVKKILCKFPQIQDQMYDEKNNTVMIKVVGCCPEKIRDKICCKGRGTIKSIEILKPPPPKPPEKPPPPPKPEEKPPPPPKPKPPPPKPEEKPPPPKPPPPCPPPPHCPVPMGCCCTECSKGHGWGPCYNQPPPKPPEKPPPPKPPAPAPAPCPVPMGCCCTECSKGRGGGPCYNPCYGQPVRYYDGYCGRPVYDSWGGGGYRGSYGRSCRCFEYCFCEDNSQGCTIM